jgi:hypothetical protein
MPAEPQPDLQPEIAHVLFIDISSLQRLLSVPYGYAPVTKAWLRIDPQWDDLRSDPRFQKLIEQRTK